MGSGRSENAEDAPKRGAFPAGLIGAEPIELAAVRQGERFSRQVTVLLKDFGAEPIEGQNRPLIVCSKARLLPSRTPARPTFWGSAALFDRPALTNPGLRPQVLCALYASPPIGTGRRSPMTH
ncbi:hypothetical protein EIB18_01880 [Caulobacter vibrioides]|nr:hypothetical protein CA608_01890 [Caulobacter vibrioides]AZH14750.1 hypothetical protein EIB18_01880 [Caulobacter vibrioides]PLR11356.1 hypothetical protein CVUC_11715 [Caulobacter vibrioides]